jgi:hypothetical protein
MSNLEKPRGNGPHLFEALLFLGLARTGPCLICRPCKPPVRSSAFDWAARVSAQ